MSYCYKLSQKIYIPDEDPCILQNIPHKIKMIYAKVVWCMKHLENYCGFILKNYRVCFFVLYYNDYYPYYENTNTEAILTIEHCHKNRHNIELKKNTLIDFLKIENIFDMDNKQCQIM